MAKIILADTGFWLGLIDTNDQYHEDAQTIAGLIEQGEYLVVMPWPCLYETISTTLTRRRQQLILLEQYLSRPTISLFEDNEYKNSALQQVFNYNRRGFTYSLTDQVMREILKDVNVKVDFFITFNKKDFQDICDQRRIDIFS